MTAYERGQKLAELVQEMRDLEESFDPRWEIVDERKVCTPDEFKEFMRGLNEGMAK